ncbi:DUF892 family protein [Silicimonas algicola]|uniref:Uncharacterized protein DUF892 n=1 Tax=Silicimonas algicola TaxID=1826607 RepID=A0A316GFK4_9RHOB|nr:DUF892 family protein [Silicimonas algicola]PWK53477.1 uncharacterized protein DUF892 [Silicimonas algicola]
MAIFSGDGIIEEAEAIASGVPADNVLNAAPAQAVEHNEIMRCGTLIAWSREPGRDDCADLLRQTMSEREAADEKRTRLSEECLNQAA